MEITVLLFLVALPVAFLTWTLRFRSIMILFATAPLALLLATTLFLNTDPNLDFTHSNCYAVANNATTAGNVTTYGNGIICQDHTDSTPIGPVPMMLVNVAMMTFVMTAVVLVYRRIAAHFGNDND